MSVIFSVIYGATVFAITTPGLVPEQVLWLGQAANIPMVVIGKMIQVIANFRQGTIHILRKHLFRIKSYCFTKTGGFFVVKKRIYFSTLHFAKIFMQ